MTEIIEAHPVLPRPSYQAPPLLAVRNIEVVYDDVILVLCGLSLDVPQRRDRGAAGRTAPASRRR